MGILFFDLWGATNTSFVCIRYFKEGPSNATRLGDEFYCTARSLHLSELPTDMFLGEPSKQKMQCLTIYCFLALDNNPSLAGVLTYISFATALLHIL